MPQINVDIVQMTMAHIPQIAAIEAEAFSMPWPQKSFADALAMEHVLFYAALAEGRVAGYCGIYLAADEGELTKIASAPGMRRQKIAWRLLETALPAAYAKGAERIFLEVRKSNIPAISLYEKTGFQAVGSRKNFYQFPTEDALVMKYEFAEKSKK